MKNLKLYEEFASNSSGGKICLVNNSYYSQEGGELTSVIVTKAPTLRRALGLMYELISDAEGMDLPDDYMKDIRSCETSSDVEGAVSACIEEWWEEANTISEFYGAKVKIVDAIPFSEERVKAADAARRIEFKEPISQADLKEIEGREFGVEYFKVEDETPSAVSALIDIYTDSDETLTSYIY
jgi:hypothetical protein